MREKKGFSNDNFDEKGFVVVLSLPIRPMAETSKPFRVIFNHLFLVWDLGGGLTIGEPGASPVINS